MIKFLHTRIRVTNFDNTIAFYTKLGFNLSDLKDSPQGNKLAFLRLPGSEHFLELCYSPEYTVAVPEDLVHTCVGVDNVIEYCAKLEEDGIEIWPDDWRTKFANPENRQMAFVTDPDGYEVEILPNQ